LELWSFSIIESAEMTPILATVLNVDKRGDEYVVSIQLEGEKYYDTFEKLRFEDEPDLGWCHYGWLDLIYHRDPKLTKGQKFPLWSVAASPFEG
jgi:hypothetical protein